MFWNWKMKDLGLNNCFVGQDGRIEFFYNPSNVADETLRITQLNTREISELKDYIKKLEQRIVELELQLRMKVITL